MTPGSTAYPASVDYDVAKVRSHFPALREGAAHFDAPGGTQTPDVVAHAVADTLTSAIANRGFVTAAERRADEIVGSCRAALGDLLGADPGAVIFGRSATQLTYDLSRAMAKDWGPGDEIVVSRLDHDANVRPWVQAAEAAGATVRWAGFDPETGEQAVSEFEAVVTERTKLVAMTAASNLIGTKPPICHTAELAHSVGAVLWVDGVHGTAHESVDIAALGADFWSCSPYKFLGPHCGVVAAASRELLEPLAIDKLLPATNDVPERFEFGTLPYELMAGTTACVDFLATLGGSGDGSTHRRDRILQGFAAMHAHEMRLRERMEAGIRALPGVRVFSNAASRTPTLLFTLVGHDDQEVRRALAERKVNAPAGSFYALECSRHLGLGDTGAIRVGLAPYTDDEDVDRLLAGLQAVVETTA